MSFFSWWLNPPLILVVHDVTGATVIRIHVTWAIRVTGQTIVGVIGRNDGGVIGWIINGVIVSGITVVNGHDVIGVRGRSDADIHVPTTGFHNGQSSQ